MTTLGAATALPAAAARGADPLGARTELSTASGTLSMIRLGRLSELGICDVDRLPAVTRILLESVLRQGARWGLDDDDLAARVAAVAAHEAVELPFLPARVLLQDFTGLPALVDLAAMRTRLVELDADPRRLDLALPCHLVIDHSVRVDHDGLQTSRARNLAGEYERNAERYGFLRWAEQAFDRLHVVPPGHGICHQVNFEHLADVVSVHRDAGGPLAMPDSVLGSDSHTTMVNGLGVLGWGVGGIEIEASLLARPLGVRTPRVVGLRLTGELPVGVLATDLVLTITELMRARGVVDSFVEVVGPGVATLGVADRGVMANMAPDFGANSCLFGIDDATLRFLRLTGRQDAAVDLVERYARAQGLFRGAGPEAPEPDFDEIVEFDLSSVEPSLAGPDRPNQRHSLPNVARSFAARGGSGADGGPAAGDVRDGTIAIAAITSCTNTSSPAAMITAGLLARHAVARGLTVPAYVKTSLAPGSRVVASYLERAGLLADLERLGFGVVGFGCTTCCGNSGDLRPAVARALDEHDHDVVAVLSGNRNYAGRIHPRIRANYLASPPLVVAYAIAGRIDRDLTSEPLAIAPDGSAVMLADVWPGQAEVAAALGAVRRELFDEAYAGLLVGDAEWKALPAHRGPLYPWDDTSTYLRPPPFVTAIEPTPDVPCHIGRAHVLLALGDHITTDHISPVGRILPDSPAARHLDERGVAARAYDSFGTRRGNWEVMVRGTFDYPALDNGLGSPAQGGVTRHVPSGEPMTVFAASRAYGDTALLILAGDEYGAGSSRDWAAKGTAMLGVRAVLARSYERIHRANLIGMGVLALQFAAGEDAASLGLTGAERFELRGLGALEPGATLTVLASLDRRTVEFDVVCRIDTASELCTYRAGGILPLVLRELLTEATR